MVYQLIAFPATKAKSMQYLRKIHATHKSGPELSHLLKSTRSENDHHSSSPLPYSRPTGPRNSTYLMAQMIECLDICRIVTPNHPPFSTEALSRHKIQTGSALASSHARQPPNPHGRHQAGIVPRLTA